MCFGVLFFLGFAALGLGFFGVWGLGILCFFGLRGPGLLWVSGDSGCWGFGVYFFVGFSLRRVESVGGLWCLGLCGTGLGVRGSLNPKP